MWFHYVNNKGFAFGIVFMVLAGLGMDANLVVARDEIAIGVKMGQGDPTDGLGSCGPNGDPTDGLDRFSIRPNGDPEDGLGSLFGDPDDGLDQSKYFRDPGDVVLVLGLAKELGLIWIP